MSGSTPPSVEPAWGLPPRTRSYHYFPGLESACGRWTARSTMTFVDDPPPDLRCGRCQYNAFGRGTPTPPAHRPGRLRELPGELALATARRLVRGRRAGDQLRVSVALLRALLRSIDSTDPRKETTA